MELRKVKEPIALIKSTDKLLWGIIVPGLARYRNFLTDFPPIKFNIDSVEYESRPREILGLLIISYLASHISRLKWVPAFGNDGRDGLVVCAEGSRKGEGMRFEQTYIYRGKPDNVSDAIKEVLKKKKIKGKNYAQEYSLLIFIDKDGEFDIRDVIQDAQESYFHYVYVVGKHNKQGLKYYVAVLKSLRDPLGDWEVKVNLENQKVSVKKYS